MSMLLACAVITFFGSTGRALLARAPPVPADVTEAQAVAVPSRKMGGTVTRATRS